MKKLLFVLPLLFILSSCEKDYDETINPSTNEYRIEWAGIQDTLDIIAGDTTLYLRIKVYPPSSISSVTAEVKNSFGNLISSQSLFDNGDSANSDLHELDSIYSNRLFLDRQDPPGIYSVIYFINGNNGASQYVQVETEKFPPFISNLLFPDTVSIGETFVFSVLAVDSNGAEDIRRVFYELYRPDGSQVSNSTGETEFPMLDDGDTNGETGDLIAGDSIYTYKLAYPVSPSFPPGRYRFEISAEDRSNKLSNKIIHFLEVLE